MTIVVSVSWFILFLKSFIAERKARVYESFDEKVYEPKLDSITLECRAFGNPLPVIDWYHNEKMIPIATQVIMHQI